MNVFDLVAKISLDTSEYDKGLDDASDRTSSFSSKAGKVFGTTAKVAGAAVAAGATAVAGMVKSSVSAYGEYEQLVGGIETLYKTSSADMLAYADNAYKTAGLSANEYMQTAIDSSAAMINSLGGDTAKAAEMTNMAIVDMSDNANKMGTSMESLQNAYRGFSRGNFTMLDNLSLGFAGTKEGMQQLLDKAEEISGIKYDISSYSDIVEAIHVVQNEMGITGTTALEASDTIQGSVGSVKGAWENLMVGLADSNADFDTLIGNFIDSLSTMGENLLPIIEKALEGVAKLIEKLAPIIADKIPELVPKIVPPLLNAATKIVAALVKALPSLIKVLVQQIPSIMAQLGQAILSTAPQILGAVVQIGGQILAFIPKLFMDLLNLIITGVTNILSPVIDFVRTWAGVFGEIFANLWNIITTIFAPAIAFFQGIWEGISTAFAPVIEFFSSIFQGAWDNIQSVWNAVTGWFSGVWDGIVGVFSGVASWFGGVFQSAWDAVTGIWEGITSFFSGVWDTVVGIFKDAGVAVGDAISGAVKGAVNAVLGGAVKIINGFISAINVALKVFNAIPGVPNVDLLPKLDTPQLEEGIGLAKKGKMYLLEGKGNEAVIPIDKDQKWTKKVAGDMITALGGNGLAGGDIIIPVYIGNDRIQEIVIKANQINSFRNGGVA
jgi:phage-related protein